MASITTQDYFVRERRVPGVEGEVGLPTEATTVANAVLNDFIAFYEPEFLTYILGADLYAEYLVGREIVGDKWKTFDAYMFNPTLKDSCVADYIFCKYWADQDTTVGDGTHLVNGENQNRVSYQNRSLKVYNRMVDGVVKAVTFLTENYDTYFSVYPPNADGWLRFVWTDGYCFRPSYDNGFGL